MRSLLDNSRAVPWALRSNSIMIRLPLRALIQTFIAASVITDHAANRPPAVVEHFLSEDIPKNPHRGILHRPRPEPLRITLAPHVLDHARLILDFVPLAVNQLCTLL